MDLLSFRSPVLVNRFQSSGVGMHIYNILTKKSVYLPKLSQLPPELLELPPTKLAPRLACLPACELPGWGLALCFLALPTPN